MLAAYHKLLQRAKFAALLFIFFLLLIFLGTFLAFLRTPLVDEEANPVYFIFPTGSSVVHLANQLYNLGLTTYPRSYLIFLAMLMRVQNHLHAGEYEIKPGMTSIELLNDMEAGRVVWRNFLFIEGWTLNQLREALDQNPFLIHKTRGLTELQLAHLLHVPYTHLEGLFFPDTYRYTAGLSDTLILRQSYQAMQQKLNAAWQSRVPKLIYHNPYQALIVASLVEKEAKLNEDRAKIAGVILKRLAIGMPLQIDASVIYGLGNQYNNHLKRVQLKIPTPYNTYLIKGLPPTPIAMPGEASIHAALHPVINQDLFYVARGDGGHVFSRTLAAQDQAIKLYRRKQRTN
mgnify:CR=1 FL=1